MKNVRIVAFLLLMVLAVTALVACGECDHNYVDGTCAECGEADPNYVAPCEHEYAEGVCTKCGEADPDYVAPCEH